MPLVKGRSNALSMRQFPVALPEQVFVRAELLVQHDDTSVSIQKGGIDLLQENDWTAEPRSGAIRNRAITNMTDAV